MHNVTKNIPWWLTKNWRPLMGGIYSHNGTGQIRPTEDAALINIDNECRRFEWNNHPNNPKNKTYD